MPSEIQVDSNSIQSVLIILITGEMITTLNYLISTFIIMENLKIFHSTVFLPLT